MPHVKHLNMLGNIVNLFYNIMNSNLTKED